MGDEPFDETILQADGGTLFIRGGWGRQEVCLGLASGRADEPMVSLVLTPLQRRRLTEALAEMAAPWTEFCWWCESEVAPPLLDGAQVQCSCGAVLQVTEDEDALRLAPVRCGHGVEHDEHCRECP
jgi:hypothetical protein